MYCSLRQAMVSTMGYVDFVEFKKLWCLIFDAVYIFKTPLTNSTPFPILLPILGFISRNVSRIDAIGSPPS